jgi:hypothetical protein
VIGQAAYISSANHVDLAKADSSSTTYVIGLVSDPTIATGASGGVTLAGVLTATTGEWDAVTGQVGGLTSGSTYFLSDATAGSITPTAPSTTGHFVAPVGIAMSTTDLKINVNLTIQI